MRHLALVAVAILVFACGSSTPTTPAPAPTPVVTPAPTPVPTTATVSGSVTATNGGQSLSSVVVSVGSQTVTSDAGGSFSFVFSPFQGNLRVMLTGSGIVTRTATAAVNANRMLPLDVIALSGGFDQSFYRNLVRNTLDEPTTMEPLRRWTMNPSFYLRTVDEEGRIIDQKSMDSVEETIRLALPSWTSNKLSVAAFQRGSGTMANVSGWITIFWQAQPDGTACGRAPVGTNPGRITFFYRTDNHCRCAGVSEASPRMVSHELGHALGFWHTDSTNDVMYYQYRNNCDPLPSARERYHAAIAYSRPVGNRDPDDDSQTSVVLSLPRVTAY